MPTSFEQELIAVINGSIMNNHQDNHDFYRFGKKDDELHQADATLAHAQSQRLQDKGAERIFADSQLAPYASRLERFYQLLADEHSRSLLVQLAAYRILGQYKVKLPLNTPDYWQGIEAMRECITDTDDVLPGFSAWSLNRFNLSTHGLPIEIYFTMKGAYTEFVTRQYEYRRDGVNIGINPGDTVIDAGACWGDTALLFSCLSGEAGQVHSFEFIPSNLNILKLNLSLNPALAARIRLVENPLWDRSGEPVYVVEEGPGSKVRFKDPLNATLQVDTLSIDDYVARNALEKVDFIKMDIEGAEQPSLRGAKQTIRSFSPRLGIAIYHLLDDFAGAFELINTIEPRYRFYLGHSSIHAEETILFAEAV